MKKAKIDVRIPYEPHGKLGWDYNRILRETLYEWVLVIDHDVVLALNPNWYSICQAAVEKHPKAGLITCMTNARHSNTGQHSEHAPGGDAPMLEHRAHARMCWERYGLQVDEIEKASGFFMLIRQSAWRAAGGFPGKGLFKEDWGFSKRLRQHKLSILLLRGLYVYHAKVRPSTWIEGEEVTKEVRRREVQLR